MELLVWKESVKIGNGSCKHKFSKCLKAKNNFLIANMVFDYMC